jgi:hypothetical protein
VATAVEQSPGLIRHAVPLAVESKRAVFAWSALAFGIAFAVLATVRFGAFRPDTFMTLTVGREVADSGIPTVERLTSAASGEAWVDQQWLAQWGFYRTWVLGGDIGAAILAALLTASAFGALTAILLHRGAGARRALKWTVLAFAVALPDTGVRAQAFAYPLFIALIWLLLRDSEEDQSPFALAAAIPLLLFWANLHGSILVGVVILAAYAAWQAARRLRSDPRVSLFYGALALAALASPLATPYGLDTLSYYRSVLGNDAIRSFASEWQPAKPTSPAAVAFYVLVALVAFILLRGLRRGRRPQLALVVVTTGLCLAGFYAMRWETWAAFLAVLLAVDLLNAEEESAKPSPRRARRPLIVATALLAAGVAVLLAQPTSRFMSKAPVGAMAAAHQYALEHPGALILADDRSADALLWKHPELGGRIGYDARLELYPQADVRAWGDFIRGDPAQDFLSPYDVLVAAETNRDLVRRLRTLPGWRVIYDDVGDGAVAVRGT